MNSIRTSRDGCAKAILLVATIAVGLAATLAAAQETPDDEGIPPRSIGWGEYVPRAGIGYEVGRGIGYPDDYGRVEGLIPLAGMPGELLVFGDVRLLIDNDANIGSNTGLGYRCYLHELDRTFGTVVYYDVRETEMKTFQQLTLSLDTLGRWWDLRTNVYVQSIFSDQAFEPARFFGNYLFLSGEERALSGLDMELTVPLPFWQSFDPRMGAGWYHFQGQDVPDLWGWKLRAEASVADSVVVDLALHDDEQFGTTVNLGLTWWLPNKWSQRRGAGCGRRVPQQRLGEPVKRLENIAILSHPSEVARDPDTGNPLVFLHVASASGQANGSFESPYGSLGAALDDLRYQSGAVDVVYVRPDAASPLTHSGDVTFLPGVQLRSNAPVQFLDTQRGPVRLPFSGTDPALTNLPRIDGWVELANDTCLSGFEIHGRVVGRDVSNVTIANNRITNSDTYAEGVSLTGAAGTVIIRDNFISNHVLPPPWDGGGWLYDLGYGIILHETRGAAVRITGNTVQNGKSGIAFDRGEMNADVIGNTITGSQTAGIHLMPGLTFSGNVTGNTISSRGDGILMQGFELDDWHRPTYFTGSISKNRIRYNWQDGIRVEEVYFSGEIRNNIISDNWRRGIAGEYMSSWYGAAVSGRFNGDIVGNIIRGNGSAGIGFTFATCEVDHRMAILNNHFSGNGSGPTDRSILPSELAALPPRPSGNSFRAIDVAIQQASAAGALYVELDGNVSTDRPLPGYDYHNYQLFRLTSVDSEYLIHLGENVGTIGAWDLTDFPDEWSDWPNWPE